MGEANGQPYDGKVGVAATILNRLNAGGYGKDIPGVVLKRSQYEPWTTRSQELMNYGPKTPGWTDAAQAVQDAIAGYDPTGGATHFLNPKTVAQRGDPAGKPGGWASKLQNALQIGDHLFGNADAGRSGGSQIRLPEPVYASLTESGVSPRTNGAPSPMAKQVPVASTAAPADDDVLSLYTKAGVAPIVAPIVSPAASMPSDDDLLSLYARKDVPVAAAAPAGLPGVLAAAPGDGAATSIAKNVGTGLVRGVGDAAGVVGNTKGLADYLLARGRSAVTGQPVDQVMAQQAANQQAMEQNATPIGKLAAYINPLNWLPTSEGTANKLLSQTGEYVPQTEAERMVQTGARTVTGIAGPGSIGAGAGANVPRNGLLAFMKPTTAAPTAAVSTTLPKAATVAGAAALSGGSGQYATDLTGDPLIGMAAGALPGATLAGARAGINRLTGTVSPETASLAQVARDKYNIPVNAGDMAETPFSKYMASTVKDLPLSGSGPTSAAQRTAFNGAVAQTFGETADKLTPQVMANARDRIGAQFDDVAKQTPTIVADRQLQSDLMQTVKNASATVTDSELKPIVKQAQNIVDAIDPATGTITGTQYQALTRRGTPLDAAMKSSNPNIKSFANEVREALDGAFERSAPSQVADQLAQARSQWKNMRTIEDLVAKTPDGDISPALLQSKVNLANKGTYGAAYGGGGDLKELANIGQRFLKEPPNSGTAPRSNILNMLAGAGTTAGAIAAQNPLIALGAVAAPVGQALTGRFMGGRMRSDAVTNALIARSLGQPVAGSNKLLNLTVPYALQSGGAMALPKR